MKPESVLVDSMRELSGALAKLTFGAPVTNVYDPTDYARAPHETYLKRFGGGPKEVVFLGMNPGPWGMAQTGVPFGEVAHVRDWMGIEGEVGVPESEHPKRRIEGFACGRSEVSGARLWGWAKDRFETADAFFSRFFVANYCPLIFLEESGRNRVPEKLPVAERRPLEAACDAALVRTIRALEPRRVIGVGAFARKRAEKVLKAAGIALEVGQILHPSPASPLANRGWAEQADAQLEAMGVSTS